MALTLAAQQRIQQLRAKVADKTITTEELREGLMLMREDRVAAHATSVSSKTRKAPVNAESLLSELDGL